MLESACGKLMAQLKAIPCGSITANYAVAKGLIVHVICIKSIIKLSFISKWRIFIYSFLCIG